MSIVGDVGSTNYELLSVLKNFDEQFAWSQFIATYSPMIRNCCRCRGLNVNEVDEVQSLVCGRLMTYFSKSEMHIHTSFRGFLAKMVENEINGHLRRKYEERLVPLHQIADHAEPFSFSELDREKLDELETSLTSKVLFIGKVIEVVQLRVNERTWQIFWDYAVLNQSVEEVAKKYCITKSTVFKYHHRVSRIAEQVAKTSSHVDNTTLKQNPCEC